MSEENLKTWPERIYLTYQWDDEGNELKKYPGDEFVNFYEGKVSKFGVEYIRADLAAPVLDERTEFELEVFKDGYGVQVWDLKKNTSGEYRSEKARLLWRLWQARAWLK